MSIFVMAMRMYVPIFVMAVICARDTKSGGADVVGRGGGRMRRGCVVERVRGGRGAFGAMFGAMDGRRSDG